MMQRAVRAIEEGGFVELRGRPWLVEEVRGDANDLQSLSLSCISDDAQGEQLEVLWDAEIGAVALDEDGWRNVGTGLPDRGMVICYLYGLRKDTTVTLANGLLEQFHISRKAKYRCLRALESAGLIAVEYRKDHNPPSHHYCRRADPTHIEICPRLWREWRQIRNF